jgi:LPXTG-motif cell wall-anchored protein
VAEGPGAGEGASLPRTGSTTVPLAFAGVGLVAAGGAAFFARRFIYVPKHAR